MKPQSESKGYRPRPASGSSKRSRSGIRTCHKTEIDEGALVFTITSRQQTSSTVALGIRGSKTAFKSSSTRKVWSLQDAKIPVAQLMLGAVYIRHSELADWCQKRCQPFQPTKPEIVTLIPGLWKTSFTSISQGDSTLQHSSQNCKDISCSKVLFQIELSIRTRILKKISVMNHFQFAHLERYRIL